MKKGDKIIIVSLFVMSFIPQVVFSFMVTKEYNQTYAVITVDGEVYKKLPLMGQVTMKEYLIETKYGSNLLVIENEQVAIREADCPDEICIEPGFVSKPGQSLICLPHRLLVQIEGVMETNDEVDIKTY